MKGSFRRSPQLPSFPTLTHPPTLAAATWRATATGTDRPMALTRRRVVIAVLYRRVRVICTVCRHRSARRRRNPEWCCADVSADKVHEPLMPVPEQLVLDILASHACMECLRVHNPSTGIETENETAGSLPSHAPSQTVNCCKHASNVVKPCWAYQFFLTCFVSIALPLAPVELSTAATSPSHRDTGMCIAATGNSRAHVRCVMRRLRPRVNQ
jgi:hypothetical protein